LDNHHHHADNELITVKLFEKIYFYQYFHFIGLTKVHMMLKSSFLKKEILA